jgi:lactate dehydrogenase-like 2-hydroxyacid dehydrogenase
MDVLTPTPLPPAVLAGLKDHFDVHELTGAADRDALMERFAPRIRAIACGAGILTGGRPFSVDAAFLARFPQLEIIANLGVGYENIDAAAAAARGVVVTNTPDVLTDEVADLAMGLLIATVREIPQADRWLRAGRWRDAPFRLTRSLRGRTLGILGLGRIGAAIAVRAAPFGLRVVYHNRKARSDVPYAHAASPLELARACDLLMIAAPGGVHTKHLVDRAVLEALGADGVVVNIARGSIVDEDALVAALRDGVIAGAGLDVFANEPHPPPELVAMDNVVLLPHVGSASRKTREDMGRLVVDNLVSWAAGRGPLTPVAETPWRGGVAERRGDAPDGQR